MSSNDFATMDRRTLFRRGGMAAFGLALSGAAGVLVPGSDGLVSVPLAPEPTPGKGVEVARVRPDLLIGKGPGGLLDLDLGEWTLMSVSLVASPYSVMRLHLEAIHRGEYGPAPTNALDLIWPNR